MFTRLKRPQGRSVRDRQWWQRNLLLVTHPECESGDALLRAAGTSPVIVMERKRADTHTHREGGSHQNGCCRFSPADILVPHLVLGECMSLTVRWESTENGNKHNGDPWTSREGGGKRKLRPSEHNPYSQWNKQIHRKPVMTLVYPLILFVY